MSAPSKENFFQSLTADTWCGWDWCRKLYGYSVTDPALLERVFARLDELNRPRVKNYLRYLLQNADSPRAGAGTGSRRMADKAD